MKIVWSTEINVPPEREAQNIAANEWRNLPRISEAANRPPLAIVGGGPSVERFIEELQNWPGDIWVSGSAFPWCLKHGIKATFFTIDQHPSLVNDGRGATKAILATCVDPGVFDELSGAEIEVFDLHHSGLEANHHATSVTACPMVGLQMGYTDMTFFGCDSSYTDTTHAYYNEPVQMAMRVKCGDSAFMTNPAMLMQAEFLSIVFRGCPEVFKVKGDGLLPAMIAASDYDITHGSVDLAFKIAASQAKDEADRINAAIAAGQKVMVVYDPSVSPPTYGDFMNVLMMARYVEKCGAEVDFVVPVGDYRDDWSALDMAERGHLLGEYRLMAETFLKSGARMVPWSEAKVAEAPYAVMANVVNRRDYFYNQAFNIINQLCQDKDKAFLDDYLLSEFPVKKPANYVTWHCRHNLKWSQDRNMSEVEFVTELARLKTMHRNVMVVSDELGCNHFKAIAARHGMTCLFSKDYSDTFVGDAGLVLASEKFYMVRGGGIGMIALFSRVPYEMRFTASNELCWNGNRFTSWAGDDQHYELSAALKTEAELKKEAA